MSRIAGSIDSAYVRAKTKRRQRSTDTLGAVLVVPDYYVHNSEGCSTHAKVKGNFPDDR
jgi:hypothetical protein